MNKNVIEENMMGPNPITILEELLEKVEIKKGSKILDLGCGKGLTSMYLAQKYDLALSEFKELYEKYPKSIYTDKTLYYLGLISQIKKDDANALIYYDKLIEEYPEASYIRSAYVKKADILVALGKKDDGIKTYKIILEKYPMTPEASMVKEKLEEMKNPSPTVDTLTVDTANTIKKN